MSYKWKTRGKTFIQIKPNDGWYENGQLVTSYAANGSSNIWTWNPPSDAIIDLNGCGGGGGGGAGSSNGASAGSGGGGGGSGTSVSRLVFPVWIGNSLKFTLGAAGSGVASSAGMDGGSTLIEHSGIGVYEYDTYGGGSLGAGAFWLFEGGKGGAVASAGSKGIGGIVNHGTSVPSSVALHFIYSFYTYVTFFSTGACGGDAGANGSASSYGNRMAYVSVSLGSIAGGLVANSAGGGGAGSCGAFGRGGAGGNGQVDGGNAVGYGASGGGGGGARANQTDQGKGGNGTAGYIEFMAEWL